MVMVKRVLKWAAVMLLVAYVVLVVVRGFQMGFADRTEKAVETIHSTRLSLDDVMGNNLPPSYAEAAAGKPDYNATVAGIDENKNGIRDDVELAIFKAYPNSARTRAVLLQYALALQMEVTQKVVNEKVVNAILEEDSRAGNCIADTLVPRKSPESARTYSDVEKIDSYLNFIDQKQFNTNERKQFRKEFFTHMGSYSNSQKPSLCDIDISTLPN